MNDLLVKVIGGILLFGGEAIAIYQEMVAARAAKAGSLSFGVGAWLFAWMMVSGVMLLAGYYLGYLSFKNIWVVTVISIGSILIAEPLLILAFFRESPTLGAWIGLILAVLGIAATIFF